MALTQEIESWLVDLLEVAQDDDPRLSKWQQSFISDIRKRYEEEGSSGQFFISPKMMTKLREIESRVDP